MATRKASWPPLPRRAPAVAAAIVAILVAVSLVLLIAGCTTHSYLYRPVPADMIPPPLELPKVRAEEIPRCESDQPPCMADETYIKFAEMVRALKQQNAELRALLGADDAHPDR